jgi:prepilin-type N-terminal cleavage/methylation domain-containing protein
MRGQRKHAGFTLIEVLIATLLIVVGLVGSIALTLGMLRTNRSSASHDTAYVLAQQALDNLGLFPLNQAGIGVNFLLPSSTPGVNDPPLGMVAAGVNPPATSCAVLPMANAQIGDAPGQCAGVNPNLAMPSYFLRTWVCCGVPPPPPAGPPLPALLGGQPCTAQAGADVGPSGLLTTPDNQNQGAICLLQAEVTWPAENLQATGTPIVGDPPLYAGNPAQLFVPEGSAGYVPYGNHILLSEVRMQ